MNARQTIVDILERGGATLVILFYNGAIVDVTVDGLQIPYEVVEPDILIDYGKEADNG